MCIRDRDLTVHLRQEIGEAYERMENQLEDIRSQIVELSLDIAGKILEKRIEEDSGEKMCIRDRITGAFPFFAGTA